MEKASMIVYLFDASEISLAEIEEQIQSFNAPYVLVGNKQDKLSITKSRHLKKPIQPSFGYLLLKIRI
jgi:tRNA modification GTPase